MLDILSLRMSSIPMEHINKALRSVSYAFPMLVQKYFFSRVEMIIFYILHNYGTKIWN